MSTATADRLKELNRSYGDKVAEMKSIADSFKVDGNNVTISTEQKAAFDKTRTDLAEIKGLITNLESLAEAEGFLTSGAGTSVSAQDAAAQHAAGGDQGQGREQQLPQYKSLGRQFVESAEFKEMRDRGLSETPRPMMVKAADIARMAGVTEREVKDIYTASGGTFTVPSFGTQQNDGLIIPAYRTTRVRDLFPTQRTVANLIEYVRRTGFTNAAAVVAERTAPDGSAATGGPTDVFGLKPASNLTYTSEQAPVRVIAHTIDMSKTVLDDMPRLQDTINGEMLYGLRLTEDAELLAGDGTGAHILGILNTPGIQAYTQADPAAGATTDPLPTDETKADAIRKASTLVMLAYYEATGVVLHPYDWEEIELQKTTFGSYVMVTNVAIGAQKQVWQQPVVQTPAMAQGTFLTGAFGLGAKVYDRELASVAISTETRDLFDRNAIALRAEERLALEVGRPESFVKGTFYTAG